MSRRIHRITIPDYHPPRLNQLRGRHWRREHRAKCELADMLRIYGTHQQCPRATGRRRVWLVVIGWWRGRRADLDAWDKCLLDSLVRSGYLVDDGAAGLEGRVTVRLHRGRKGDRRTMVYLEDV